MTDDPTPLNRLLATDELRDIQARLCHSVSERDWREVQRLFTHDGQFRAYSQSGALECFAEGQDIGHILQRRLSGGPLIVRAFDPELTVSSRDRAAGVWSVEHVLTFESGAAREQGFGVTDQAYTFTDGAWRLRSIEYSRRLQFPQAHRDRIG